VCPACGAAIKIDAKSCWLCRWELTQEIVTAEIVSEPPDYVLDSTSTRTALVVGIITLGLATVGVLAAAPGVGILMGIGFVIALFAVAQGLQSDGPVLPHLGEIAQAYEAPRWVPAAKHSGNVIHLLKVLGIIGLLGVASIIAFLTFCVLASVAVYKFG
jgi:hypothetical protein